MINAMAATVVQTAVSDIQANGVDCTTVPDVPVNADDDKEEGALLMPVAIGAVIHDVTDEVMTDYKEIFQGHFCNNNTKDNNDKRW